MGVSREQVDETNMSAYSCEQACLMGVSSGCVQWVCREQVDKTIMSAYSCE